MKTLKWIGTTLGMRKWMVVMLAAIQSIMAISGIIFALLMRGVIDNAVAKDNAAFWQAVSALAILICLQIVLRFINRFWEEDTHAAIENGLRLKMFQGILQTD